MENLLLLIDSVQYSQFALNPIGIFTILDQENIGYSTTKNIEKLSCAKEVKNGDKKNFPTV